jgi:hypothetical protein
LVEELRIQSNQVQVASVDCGYLTVNIAYESTNFFNLNFFFSSVKHRIASCRERLRIRKETLAQAQAQLAVDVSHQSELEEELTNERCATTLLLVSSFFLLLHFAGLGYWPFKRISHPLAPP